MTKVDHPAIRNIVAVAWGLHLAQEQTCARAAVIAGLPAVAKAYFPTIPTRDHVGKMRPATMRMRPATMRSSNRSRTLRTPTIPSPQHRSLWNQRFRQRRLQTLCVSEPFSSSALVVAAFVTHPGFATMTQSNVRIFSGTNG